MEHGRERFGVPVVCSRVAVVAAWGLGMRGVGPLGTLGLAVFVGGIMLDELLRGARARSRSRGEDPATAAWRLATRNRRRYGGYLVHFGILVMAVAVAVSSGLASQTSATLRPGESVRLAGYVLTYDRLVVEPLAADPRVTEARAELTYSGSQEGRLATALRDYPNSTTRGRHALVRTALGEDLYVTLLAYDTATRTVTVRVFVNPLVVWIWVGGAIIGIGPPSPSGRSGVAYGWKRPRRSGFRPPNRRHRSRGPSVRNLRWLLVPLVVVPLTLLLFHGFGRDPACDPLAAHREAGALLLAGRPRRHDG